MRMKRLGAALLAAALAASLLVLPVSAAPGSFSDISDPATAVNADILRLMGVVTGTGGNQFQPGGTLTRAQFCTLMVRFLQKEEEARRYATRTIFSDVKSNHWARSYVNLAASTQVKDGEGTIPLISGDGTGRFLPDAEIHLAEAVTILLRALGYSGDQAGAVWPQGYINLAASVGLTDGVNAGTGSPLTRAQAAQLFVNALKCKTAEGTVYYKTLGTVADKTIILAVNVETDDGSSKGAVRTTLNEESEAYLPAQGEGNVTALQGKRGDLVLNDKEEIITFVPDDSTAVTITLSGNAQASYVKAAGGRQYTVSGSTPVYTASARESQPYSAAFSTLTSGSQITLYTEKGKVSAVYAAGASTSAGSDCVVVMGSPSVASFHQLTGGVSDFRIMKNRQSVSLSDIKEYDVVTYDQMTNTLIVSDLRLTCVYADALPNSKAPQTIKVLDNEFTVLESAWDTCGGFKPGDTVTLLLTADGNVAGMAAPGKARSTAIGMAGDGGVNIFRPDGGVLNLKGKISSAGLDNQLVTVSGAKSGISVSRLSSRTAPGDFSVTGMRLGSYTVTAGVRIYEQVKGGAMVEINRGDLALNSVPAGRVATYHLNSANMVDYIVLSDVTGDAYQYGMMVSETTHYDAVYKTDADGNPTSEIETPERTVTNWKLIRSGDPIPFAETVGYAGRSGDMVGVVTGTNRNGENTIAAIIQLTQIKNVKASDFFESQGVQHVTINGRTYRVADGVECFRKLSNDLKDAGNWVSGATGADRLASVKAYGESFTIYVDPVGQQVRVVAAD